VIFFIWVKMLIMKQNISNMISMFSILKTDDTNLNLFIICILSMH